MLITFQSSSAFYVTQRPKLKSVACNSPGARLSAMRPQHRSPQPGTTPHSCLERYKVRLIGLVAASPFWQMRLFQKCFYIYGFNYSNKQSTDKSGLMPCNCHTLYQQRATLLRATNNPVAAHPYYSTQHFF